jgi:alpha-tubulin suppressor-like RCC1 family protein
MDKKLPVLRHLENARNLVSPRAKCSKPRTEDKENERPEGIRELPQVDRGQRALCHSQFDRNVTRRKRRKSDSGFGGSTDDNATSDTSENRSKVTTETARSLYEQSKQEPGTVFAFGSNEMNRFSRDDVEVIRAPARILPSQNVRYVCASYNNSFIIMENNQFHELYKLKLDKWTKVDFSHKIQAVTGATACFIIAENGQLWSWGKNDFGQAGHGNAVDFLVRPARIDALARRHIVQVDCANKYAACVDDDGRVFMWGDFNSSGRSVRVLPFQINLNHGRVSQIACGEAHLMMLSDDGNTVWVRGSNRRGQLGNGTIGGDLHHFEQLDTLINKDIVQIAAGAHSSAALTRLGNVYVWGGAMGARPNIITGLSNIIDIAMGWSHLLALTRDKQLLAQGWNASGQCGVNTNSDKIEQAMTIRGLQNRQVLQISAGRAHSFIKCKA